MRSQTQVCPFVVITGGPSVGKTTLINELRQRGHLVLPEVGTNIILEGKLDPSKDRYSFQSAVLERQLEQECSCYLPLAATGQICFCDRGLLDGAAYFMHAGIEVPEIYAQVPVSHYLLCILVQPLDTFERSPVRADFENLEYTQALTPLLELAYASRGVEVVRLPKAPVEERLEIILSICSKRNM